MKKRPLRQKAENYINKAKEIHKDKYDYSKVIYKGVKEKVEIVCPLHGSFWQTFDNHVNSKKNCPACARESVRQHRRKNTSHFITKAKQKHGDFYIYDKVIYIDQDTPVTITCPEHGDFFVKPSLHYQGGVCQKCLKGKLGSHNKITHEEFIKRSQETHNNYYIYDKTKYVVAYKKVIITCPKHGDWKQLPSSHLRGSGCRECWYEAYGYGVNGYYGTDKPSNLYVANFEDKFIKVGLSKDLNRRIRDLVKQSGIDVDVIYTLGGNASSLFDLEQDILRNQNLSRYLPKQEFNGKSECLNISELPKVLQIIQEWEKENVGTD